MLTISALDYSRSKKGRYPLVEKIAETMVLPFRINEEWKSLGVTRFILDRKTARGLLRRKLNDAYSHRGPFDSYPKLTEREMEVAEWIWDGREERRNDEARD